MIFLEKQMGKSTVFRVIDDQLWNGESATVWNKLKPKLPQEEPLLP
jgi:hypothetical protein